VSRVNPGLSAVEVAILRHLSTNGPLRHSLRYIDDVAATLGVPTGDLDQALNSLVRARLLVSQELVDEEPDALTGERGRTLRLTPAGQRMVDRSA
jgi:DNA-binding MarR family transcriptional regulator